MRYTDEIIEEVRSRNDIVDIISGYVKLTRHGNSYFGLCPFHNEKTPSFSVSPDKQMYYCFGCHAGGNVFTFLMNYENYTFQEAIKILAERAGIQLPESDESAEASREADEKAVLREINKNAAEYYYLKLQSPSGQTALKYLTGRGITADTIRNFGLGYSDKYSNDLYRYMKKKGYSDEVLKDSGLFRFDEKQGVSDKFWNRVMYPIMDANSRVIGFGGRVMGDGKPKYLNSPETKIFDKSRNLYGLYAARRTRRKYFIICEGYMDVISMHQAGYTNAVASLGTALTSQQCSLMSRFTKEALVIYDMDEAGVNAAIRAIPMLQEAGIHTKVVNLRPHKDPDEFLREEGAEAFEKRLDEAENSFIFMLRMEQQQYDMKDPQGKSDFLNEAAQRLAGIPNELEREVFIREVARLWNIDEKILRREIVRIAMSGREFHRPEKKNPVQKNHLSGNSDDKAQKLMLTWMTTDPSLIRKMKKYLSLDDFVTPLYREVAGMVFAQELAGKVSPAEIINHFPEAEQQSEVASLFNTNISLDTEKEKKKALFDVWYKMKDSAIQKKMSEIEPSDISMLSEIMAEKRKLDAMRSSGLPDDIL